MKLDIKSRSGRVILSLDVDPSSTTLLELKKTFYKQNPKLYPERQRFSLPPVAGQPRGVSLTDDSKSLASYGLQGPATELQFKDLGPQIAWTTVFFWEYFGPLIVYPLFYFVPQVYSLVGLKPRAGPRPIAQQLALAYWCFHYIKRIAETFLVHKFGHSTMPIFNLFKNCSYYWGFAAFVSYFVNHPLYTAPAELQTFVALGVALLCQFSNLKTHLTLANLRAPGEKEYKIPKGFGFDYISCANYTFEIMGWVFYSVATQSLPALLFTLAGAAQMAQWALQKHKRLLKTFDGKEGRLKYPRRWIMLPPFF